MASEVDVADAMMRAADDGAHVINLSLGMQAVDDGNPCPALKEAVADILNRDEPPAIVASAGNYGTTEKVYPAALDGVVSVAGLQAVQDPQSTTPPDGADWSTHGDWVVCSTVGEGIVSTFVKGQEDPVFGDNDVYPHNGQGDSWAVWTGTSFAAPQIAGLISATCREQGLKPGKPSTCCSRPVPVPRATTGSRCCCSRARLACRDTPHDTAPSSWRGAPSLMRVEMKKRLRGAGAFSVSEGGLEPPPSIRGLAPQASASAYSATRTSAGEP